MEKFSNKNITTIIFIAEIMKKKNRYTVKNYGTCEWGENTLLSDEGKKFKASFSNDSNYQKG